MKTRIGLMRVVIFIIAIINFYYLGLVFVIVFTAVSITLLTTVCLSLFVSELGWEMLTKTCMVLSSVISAIVGYCAYNSSAMFSIETHNYGIIFLVLLISSISFSTGILYLLKMIKKHI